MSKFKVGDRVKLSKDSVYAGRGNQLPLGVVGKVKVKVIGRGNSSSWYKVEWISGHNTYPERDLLPYAEFKGNK